MDQIVNDPNYEDDLPLIKTAILNMVIFESNIHHSLNEAYLNWLQDHVSPNFDGGRGEYWCVRTTTDWIQVVSDAEGNTIGVTYLGSTTSVECFFSTNIGPPVFPNSWQFDGNEPRLPGGNGGDGEPGTNPSNETTDEEKECEEQTSEMLSQLGISLIDLVEQGVEINDCCGKPNYEECINNLIFDFTFDLLDDAGPLIDLAQLIENCFGMPDGNGNYIDCNTFSGILSATLYVDQPVPGHPSPYSGIADPDIGHTFIGFSSTDEGGNIQNLTFGFYPFNGVKPITNPSSPSVIINDGSITNPHVYDVSLTYNVNCHQFNQLLIQAISQSEHSYNLNDYNCTDFGLETFNNALNINIFSPPSTWPGGIGNSPGGLGFSISHEIGIANGIVNSNTGIAPLTTCN